MQTKPNLDLLRASAILLVVLDHILVAKNVNTVLGWESAWIGLIGVYWFFVHTSLVLMWSLERKPHTLDFYVRRIFRIYPLAITLVTITVLFHARVSATSGFFSFYRGTHRQILANLFLAQNFTMANRSLIYVMWSLPLEVDMYLVLPVIFFFVRRNFSLWPLLLFWTFSVALIWSDFLRAAGPEGNYFLSDIPCFLPGIMAYVLFQRVRPVLAGWLFPVFLVVLCAYYMHKPSVHRSWPMCLGLALCLPFFRQIRYAPLVRTSHELAKYSYGIYLIHPFGLAIGFYYLRAEPLWIQLSAVLLSTAGLSILAYHTLEKPMIDLGSRVARRVEQRYRQRHMAEVL